MTQRRPHSIPAAAFKGWLAAFLILLIGGGCDSPVRQTATTAIPPPTVTVSGFTIPVFATANEQLNYAKSLSANPMERSAALNLIPGRFPDDRLAQGETRLELAYLHLGRDFRLADAQACHRALTAYEATAREFSDLPAIRVKAYWYMAWIYTDLLKDKRKGLALYARLAETHPMDSFSRISPVPWLRLVFPDPEIKPYTADDRHTHSWAGLALLEIVRLADDPQMRQQAFEKLWIEHRRSLTTGFALKAMLHSPTQPDDIAAIVAEYIAGNGINAALNEDLTAALADWRTGQTAVER